MNELVTVLRKNVVVSSLDVCMNFGKRHDRVLRAIENAISNLPKNGDVKKAFIKSTYIDSKGEVQPMYYLTRDGFSFVVMGFTGKKAAEWKWKYIQAFNYMENLLLEKQTEEWQEARIQGKTVRREYTDAIKDYVELAKEQGHDGTAKFAYSNLSKLVKKPFGSRDSAEAGQLALIAATEHVLSRSLSQMVEAKEDVKEIYGKLRGKAQALTGAMLQV